MTALLVETQNLADLLDVSRDEYNRRCVQRWHGEPLLNARVNWFGFEKIKDELVSALRQYKNNPGQEDLSGKFHNPDYTLTSFLWKLQEAIQPDRSCLNPLLDFEEHHQKVFLRRGLIIYCSLILERLEASKGWAEPPLIILSSGVA